MGSEMCIRDSAYSGGNWCAGSGVYRATGWGAYLQRHNYRRPARLPCAVLLYPTAAGADLLPVAGKPGEEATGEK